MCSYAASERVWVYTLNFWCLNPAVVSVWVWAWEYGGGSSFSAEGDCFLFNKLIIST